MGESSNKFLQTLAGGIFGAGAGLVGADPTYLGQELQRNRERRRRKESLEAVQKATEAGNPDEAAEFRKAVGDREFHDVAEYQQAYGAFRESRQLSKDEADAKALWPQYADQLDAHGIDSSGLREATGVTHSALIARAQELLVPEINRRTKRLADRDMAAKRYKGMSDDRLRRTLIVEGVPEKQIQDLSREDMEDVGFASGVTPIGSQTGAGFFGEVSDEDMDAAAELAGIDKEVAARLKHDPGLSLEEHEVAQKLRTALGTYRAEKKQVALYTKALAQEAKAIHSQLQQGLISEAVAYQQLNQVITEGQAKHLPEGTRSFANELPQVEEGYRLGIQQTADAQRQGVAWLESPEGGRSLDTLAMIGKEEASERASLLPANQRAAFQARWNTATEARTGALLLGNLKANFGNDPVIAMKLGYGDFVGDGPYASADTANLDELSPKAVNALRRLPEEGVDQVTISRAQPILQAVQRIPGLSQEEVGLMFDAALANNFSTSSQVASIFNGKITALMGPLTSQTSDATSTDVQAAIRYGATLKTLQENPDFPLPATVLDHLTRMDPLLQAVSLSPELVNGRTPDEAWAAAQNTDKFDHVFRDWHENLRGVPTAAASAAVQDILSLEQATRTAGARKLREASLASAALAQNPTSLKVFAGSGRVFNQMSFENGQPLLNGMNYEDLLEDLAGAEGTHAANFLDEMARTFAPDLAKANEADISWRGKAVTILREQLVANKGRVTGALSPAQEARAMVVYNASLHYAVAQALLQDSGAKGTVFGDTIVVPEDGQVSHSEVAYGMAEEWYRRQLEGGDRLLQMPASAYETAVGNDPQAMAYLAATGERPFTYDGGGSD